MAKYARGHTFSLELRVKMSQTHKALWRNPEHRERQKSNLDKGRETAHNNQRGNPVWREHMREVRQLKLPLEDIKRMFVEEKMSTAEIGCYFKVCSGTILERVKQMGITRSRSESMRLNWQKPDFASKVIGRIHAQPNIAEQQLLTLLNQSFPNVWHYTGSGQLLIQGKCPDFSNNGKLLIELFGDHWHKGENPQDRIDYFAKFGFSAIVIWEHELKKPEQVLEKLAVWNIGQK